MISPETCAIIVMLASVDVFRRLQIACHAFKLSSAQQFMVRCRERELRIIERTQCTPASTFYEYQLRHNNNDDGVHTLIFRTNSSIPRVYKYLANGKLHGNYRSWYPSGQLHQHYIYIDGKLHGETRDWHANGQLWLQSRYNYGIRHGDQCTWYMNGNIYERYTYVNGVRMGEYSQWYESGQLREHYMYIDGKIHGDRRMWTSNGHLSILCVYVNGKRCDM